MGLSLVLRHAGPSGAAANGSNLVPKAHGSTMLSVLSSGLGARGAVGESSAGLDAQNVVDSEAVADLLAEARHAIIDARKVQVQMRSVAAT